MKPLLKVIYSSLLFSVFSLLGADIAAAAVLISMGAVLGRTSPIQLILMSIIEIAVFSANSYLGGTVFKASKIVYLSSRYLYFW